MNFEELSKGTSEVLFTLVGHSEQHIPEERGVEVWEWVLMRKGKSAKRNINRTQ